MARSKSGFYSTIEYIGPRPQKPKKGNFFGGWVIVVIALGIGFWFGQPLIPFIKATQMGASDERAALLIASLENSQRPGDRLAAIALAHSGESIEFDSSYYKIAYPNGDIPSNKGVAADVIVRCYRKLGIDLQVKIHEDMAAYFREYPGIFGSSAPDTNIDHRRVANLQRYFARHGETLPPSRNTSDYAPGDIVVWALANAEKHIGIVVPCPTGRNDENWVVHNMSSGVKWENVLFDYSIEGHFRYPAETGLINSKDTH